MARLKRAASDPAVLRPAATKRRCIAVAVADQDSEAADPDCTSADQGNRPRTPASADFETDSNYTEFRAPPLVQIEAQHAAFGDSTASRSASCASSTIDLVDEGDTSPLSEFGARHIARGAQQRAHRRRNLPPRNRTVYTCRPCARSFTSRRVADRRARKPASRILPLDCTVSSAISRLLTSIILNPTTAPESTLETPVVSSRLAKSKLLIKKVGKFKFSYVTIKGRLSASPLALSSTRV